ncbi:glycosyltransferase family 9 protein [Paraburkholderia sp. BL10I2N1]|uniref:glycosyltransferase family 9 protein n=1 Tax=Paraburkholderia sp. BL10I2N1 TaxID=1938796 RepID=UPI00105F86AA|nr:glycosyltransferase family 9 protein [Paraburkholderia sp. BL10I2N1]TDN70545.1 ADP-heptose:LPS heptosyltransferase [Paraburkholderia sp. BL10I2N1]
MGWKGSLIEAPLWLAGRLRPSGIDPLREEPRNILVLRPNDFGDLLTTTPLFEALRRRFPSTRLVAGIGQWGRAVLENNPFVDEIVEVDAPWNNKIVKDQSLRSAMRFIWGSEQVDALRRHNGFDVGIDVLGSHLGVMLMLRAGARYRIGVRGYRGGWSACHAHIGFTPEVHVARAALAQAELLGARDLPEPRPQLYLTEAERSQAAHVWRADSSLEPRPVRLLVGCAAGLPEKSWSAEAMGTALGKISRLLAPMAGSDIVIIGGPADQTTAAQIMAHAGPRAGIRSMVGQASLRGTFALAEQADVVLTYSSMLLHVAAAFRRPTLAVLGGTSEVANAQAHDVVWGYPAPYSSVGPSKVTPGKPAANWPTVDRVVEAVLDKARNAPVLRQPHQIAL